MVRLIAFVTTTVPLASAARAEDDRASSALTERRTHTRGRHVLRMLAILASLTALPSSLADATERSAKEAYVLELHAHIARFKHFPNDSGLPRGTVRIAFALDASGRLLKKSTNASSCRSGLDQEALDMLDRAVPLPPFPQEIRERTADFVVPVIFAGVAIDLKDIPGRSDCSAGGKPASQDSRDLEKTLGLRQQK